MDWNNLKFFLALAETGSLSRASEKLRVDHSTVARRIEMLERDLGVRLVERLSRAYRLTAEGEQVRDRAREVETGIADIARLAHSVDHSPQRVVRIASITRRSASCGSAGRRHCFPDFSHPVFWRFRDNSPACVSNSSANHARSASVRAKATWRCGW
jgi:DNA-binding transcriptional LysR family regulator